MSFSLVHCLKQRALPLHGISLTDPSLRAGEAQTTCVLPAFCATSIPPLLPHNRPEADGWMCGFMAGHRANSFHRHTPAWPYTTGQPRAPQVKPLLQQQSSSAEVAPHRMSPAARRKCQRSELWMLRSQLCPSSILHAASQSSGKAWDAAGAVAQHPVVESHPEGPNKCIWGPTSHVQYLTWSTRFPMSPHRWGSGRAEPSFVIEGLRTNWKAAVLCVLTAPLTIPCAHTECSVCSVSPCLSCYSACASPEGRGKPASFPLSHK